MSTYGQQPYQPHPYGQQSYGPPQPYEPPAAPPPAPLRRQKPPKRKSHPALVLTTLGIVVILGILIGVIATSGGDNQDTHTATSPVINTGLPPKPDAKTAAAYITALEKIDPAIVSETDADSPRP
jgi:hypothetical protein